MNTNKALKNVLMYRNKILSDTSFYGKILLYVKPTIEIIKSYQ